MGRKIEAPKANSLPETAWAETPASVEEMPAMINIQENGSNPGALQVDTDTYISGHPSFMERALRLGHDVVAYRGGVLIAALGIAAGAAALGAYVYHRHQEQDKNV